MNEHDRQPEQRQRRHALSLGLGLGLALLLALASCSGYRSFREAQHAELTGDWDTAVLRYMELVTEDPADLRYRAGLLRAKTQAAHAHFEAGRKLQEAGRDRDAMLEMQRAVQLDPTNQYALTELEKLRTKIETSGLQPRTISQMKDDARAAEPMPPTLSPLSNEPVSFDFPNATFMEVYRAIGQAFGINIVFDTRLRDAPVGPEGIELRDVTAIEGLEILMHSLGHFYRVLDEQTIMILQDTQQNRQRFEDRIIQTFFLSNSDVSDVMTILRSLLNTRFIATNERLNAIAMLDSVEKVKIAQRLIEQNDKAKAEVVIDVELLQINTSKLQQLGLSLDANRLGISLDIGGEEVPLRLSDVESLNQNNWVLTVPGFLFDFVKNATDAQTLAKPQVRITEGEEASFSIGDRVPIPVTSFNTANTAGSNIVPITSYQYQNVGIEVDITPRVHHNEEVSLDLSIEVSNISGQIESQPIIGSRNINTSIRLRDGETNFLAGLIRTSETNSQSGIPGLSEIPVLGRLFSRRSTDNERTDIVLTLTPHIIRRADIREEDLAPIWVGTESNVVYRGSSPRVDSGVDGPFDEPAAEGGAVDELQNRLPPGLRDAAPEGGEPPEEDEGPPLGVELVPPPPGNPPRNAGLLDSRAAPDSPRIPSSPQVILPAAFQERAARSTGGIELTFAPEALRASVGDSFEVRLDVRSTTPLSHLPLRLRFDPSLIEVTAVRAGSFLGGEEEISLMTDDSAPGTVVVGLSRLGDRQGVAGRGRLLALEVRAVEAGTATIAVEQARPRGPALEELAPPDVQPIEIEIRAGESPDREPPETVA
jgi:general secretion pathway protein D